MNKDTVIFTNVFTLSGQDPSKNRYVEMLGIWYLFLKSFGGLTEKDQVMLLMDEATHAFMRGTGEVDDFFKEVRVGLYKQPTTLMEGMKARYSFAAHLQTESPGTTFLYLDLDVLVCRPLNTLFDPVMARNRILYTTEEKIAHISGDLLTDNYLGDRAASLTEEQRLELANQGGITSGIFGWHNSKPTCSDFFKNIVEKIDASDKQYYTADQPFFNEAVVLERLRSSWSTYHIDSSKVGINEDMRPDSPYVLMNYSGEPGNGDTHMIKLMDAHAIVFDGVSKIDMTFVEEQKTNNEDSRVGNTIEGV